MSKNKPTAPKTKRNKEVLRLWLGGLWTQKRIADKFNITEGRVWQIIRRETKNGNMKET